MGVREREEESKTSRRRGQSRAWSKGRWMVSECALHTVQANKRAEDGGTSSVPHQWYGTTHLMAAIACSLTP